MGRKCSKCGKVGHNSRTCRKERGMGRKIKLFGVQINGQSNSKSNQSCSLAAMLKIKKSQSTGSLQSSSSSSCSCYLPSTTTSSSSSSHSQISSCLDQNLVFDGRPHQKTKGVPWTEEEHKTFLRGLEKLGKGDWRGISREFVRTRTPTQVASHAQKYFLRQLHPHKFHKDAPFVTRPNVVDTVKSSDLVFEQDKGSKCKPSDHSIKFGLSSPKTSCTMHNTNKHEFGEPLVTKLWIQDFKQASSPEELNLELTLESGKGVVKNPSRVPSSSHVICFAT